MKDKILILVLIFLAIPTFSSLVRSGYYPMHDDMQAMRLLQLGKCFSDGQIPCRWVPDMGYGYGYPQFNFYGPTPYYLMFVFNVLGFSVLGSVKAYVIAISIIGLIGVYLLGKELWGRVGGFISALIFMYAPYRATEIYVRGAMGELFAMSILAYLLWSVKRVIDGKRFAILYMAFFYSLLLTSHNISTLIFTPVLILWAGVLLISKKLKFREYWQAGIKLLAGFGWGVMLGAYFILPAFLEKKYVHVETLLLGYFDYRRHFVGIKQLLFETFWGYGSSELGRFDGLNLSVGLILWLTPLVSLFFWIILGKRKKELFYLIFLAGVGWFGLFMSHVKSSFIWDNFFTLTYMQFPWRFLSLSTVMFAAASGSLNIFLKQRKNRIVYSILLFVILVLMYGFYFRPQKWLDINDEEKFSGENWERQMTISIYDYLPIYAEHPPSERAPLKPIFVEGDGEVLEYKKGTDWSRAKINVKSQKAIISEPSYYFPDWKVFLNGKKTEISYDNELGLISYNLGKGIHQVSLKLEDTLVRKASNLLTVVGLILIPIYFYYKKYEKSN